MQNSKKVYTFELGYYFFMVLGSMFLAQICFLPLSEIIVAGIRLYGPYSMDNEYMKLRLYKIIVSKEDNNSWYFKKGNQLRVKLNG